MDHVKATYEAKSSEQAIGGGRILRDDFVLDMEEIPASLRSEMRNHGFDLTKAKDKGYQLLLRLAMTLSHVSDHICSKPKAGILRLGDVIHLMREPRVSEVITWVRLMQLWGFYIASMPHIPLSEARMRAHRQMFLSAEACRKFA